jgi:hypothetical protein
MGLNFLTINFRENRRTPVLWPGQFRRCAIEDHKAGLRIRDKPTGSVLDRAVYFDCVVQDLTQLRMLAVTCATRVDDAAANYLFETTS